MRVQTLFFAAASLAVSLASGDKSHVQRDLKTDGNPAAARAENDAYWASYLQAVDSFPSAAPTGECRLDVTLNCTYVSPETGAVLPCTTITNPTNQTNCIIEVVYGISACNEGIEEPLWREAIVISISEGSLCIRISIEEALPFVV